MIVCVTEWQKCVIQQIQFIWTEHVEKKTSKGSTSYKVIIKIFIKIDCQVKNLGGKLNPAEETVIVHYMYYGSMSEWYSRNERNSKTQV